jgi:hypothetical protein
MSVRKQEIAKEKPLGREGVQRLLRTNPEFAEAYRRIMEYKRPEPPPEPEVLIKVTGPTAAKVRDNPGEVFVGVREPNGVTTMERNPNHVTVLVDRVLRTDGDGKPVYPPSGAVHAYNPIDALE